MSATSMSTPVKEREVSEAISGRVKNTAIHTNKTTIPEICGCLLTKDVPNGINQYNTELE